MKANIRVYSNGKSFCPFCRAKHAPLITRSQRAKMYTKRILRQHFKIVHSQGDTYKLELGKYLMHGARSWAKRRFLRFSIEGPCGCGCGQVLSYPDRAHPAKRMGWAVPDRVPPFFASGHLSRLQAGNKGRWKKGHESWNKGTKGLMKRNSGSFHKGQVPPNFNGGVMNAQGYIYIKSDQRHPCGAIKYISRARTVGAQLAGRPLTPNDVVLHLDGNPGNDDPANLRVVTRAESMGIKHEKLEAARRISPGVCGRCKTLKPDPAGPCPRCGRKNNQGYLVDGPKPTHKPRAPKDPAVYGPPRPPGRPRKVWPPPAHAPIGRPRKTLASVAPAKDVSTIPLPAMKEAMKVVPRPARSANAQPPRAPAPPAPLFTGPTCSVCGTLILDRFKPCPRCVPDHEHKPPSPRPAMVRLEQEDTPIDEEGIA